MKEEVAGYIFFCSDVTEAECFRRSLAGGTDAYLPRVKNLRPRDAVFIYNLNSKKLHGPFEATSSVKANIVASAWGGIYPQQVRLRRMTPKRPLSREDLAGLLKFDAFGRPSARLSRSTVDQIVALFKSPKRAKTYRDDIQIRCLDGHMVRSEPEQTIDNWLYSNRIVHAYEAPVGSDRCDFMIPTEKGDVYLEYWGLTSEPYIKNKQRKEKIYESLGLKLISLYRGDLKNLKEKLGFLL